MFLTESWFWRGTQSAIFYYVSCAPCLEVKYKRTRRKEAERAYREKSEIITDQPGRVIQPGPFETNPDWAEEIIMGPGPPKGWKKEKILQGYTESARERYRNETKVPRLPSWSLQPIDTDTEIAGDTESTPQPLHPAGNGPSVTFSEIPTTDGLEERPLERSSLGEPMSPVSESTTNTNITASSDQQQQQHEPGKSRPSMERRLSSAVENIKDTIKGWNLKRYEREDEILSGLNERLSRMWDKATKYGTETGPDPKKGAFVYGRKRAGTTETTATMESERYDWERAVRNPEINEMHPPTVSQLPATRDDAAWMLLPPPSAAVMAGKVRPQEESPLRWPLAQIGRNEREQEQIKLSREMEKTRLSESRSSAGDSGKTPDLSNSSSDEGWSDDEEEESAGYFEDHKRHSAPVEGWMPVVPPKSVTHIMHRSSQTWRRDEAWRAPPVY